MIRAAKALGQMGEAAARHPEVVPRLVAALGDPDRNVRAYAAGALERMMGQGVRIFQGQDGKLVIRTVAELSRAEVP